MVRNKRLQAALIVFALLVTRDISMPFHQVIGATEGTPAPIPTDCPVTQPNNVPYPEFGEVNPPSARDPEPDGGYGNAALWTNLWMWGEGEVVVPRSHVMPDGAFGEMKWAWFRHVPGSLTITGHRLDSPAPPLRAWIPEGYGARGFQVTGIIFPSGGCWEITGRVNDSTLTFVTLVVPPPPVMTASPATPAAERLE